MDEMVSLGREQEARLQEHAERFVRKEHGGDTMRALKAMMLLNSRLQQQIDTLSGELKYPRRMTR